MDNLIEHLRTTPDGPLIESPSGALSRSEFVASVDRIARAFRGCEASAGAWLMVRDERPLAFYPLVYGAWAAGMRVIFPTRDITEGRARFEYFHHEVTLGDDGLPRLGPSSTCRVPSDVPDEVDLVIFSSGSTGVPKGVCHPHASFLANAVRVQRALSLSGPYRSFTPLKPYLVSAYSHFLVHALDGAVLHFVENDRLSALGTLSQMYPDAALVGSPMHVITGVSQLAAEARPAYFFSSGDFMYRANIAVVRARFPEAPFFKVYGLAELGGRFFVQRIGPETPPDAWESLGAAIDDVTWSVRERELQVDAPFLFRGYLKPDGWHPAEHPHPTGDLSARSGGYRYLTGRANTEVKVAGNKLSLPMIESRILSALSRTDVALVASPHPRLGTLLVLALAAPVARTRREVMGALRETLEPWEMPHRYVVVDAIPRTASMKIDRPTLLQQLDTYPALS